MSDATPYFEIKNLCARCEEKEILKGVNLVINKGEVHALMGPNGSGKSTLSSVIMGHPAYTVTGGEILFQGQNIIEMETDQRAKLGLFLAFQYPVAIPGVSVAKFLKSSSDAILGDKKKKAGEFLKSMREDMKFLEMNETFVNRNLNEGFSGGEKKRMEILQMLSLKPGLAVMDETDSGLDIDALRIVSKGVNKLVGDNFSLLLITHYERILEYIKPDHLHVLMDGRIVHSAGPELVKELEAKGYDWVRQEFGNGVLATA
jgi:Fe-S cluster assembly ATP-binding protein